MSAPNHLDPKSLEQLVKMHKQGIHHKDIAKILDVTTEFVDRYMRDLSISNKGKGSLTLRNLTKEQEQQILQLLQDGRDDDYISRATGYPSDLIRKLRKKHGINVMSAAERTFLELSLKLRNKYYYKQLKTQLTPEELALFECMWVDYMLQFKEDVLPTEENAIKQLIVMEILMDRSMTERRRSLKDIEQYSTELDAEYNKEPHDRDAARIHWLTEKKTMAEMAQKANTDEHNKLLQRAQALQKDLKSTRDQRVDRIENSKSSWLGLLRYLEDERIREREGLEAEVVKESANYQLEKYANSHKYADDSYDLPILTPETIVAFDETKSEDKK
jgi:transposase